MQPDQNPSSPINLETATMSHVLHITEDYYDPQIPARRVRSIYHHLRYYSALDSTTRVVDSGQNKLIEKLWNFIIQLVVALTVRPLRTKLGLHHIVVDEDANPLYIHIVFQYDC